MRLGRQAGTTSTGLHPAQVLSLDRQARGEGEALPNVPLQSLVRVELVSATLRIALISRASTASVCAP